MVANSGNISFTEDIMLLREVMDASRNCLAIIEPPCSVLISNKGFASHFGISSEDIAGSSLNDILDKIDPEAVEVWASISNAIGNGRPVDGARLTINGRWFEVFASPVSSGTYPGITLLSLKDITEKNLADAALRKSETQYKDLVNNSLVGIFKSNLDGELLFANDESLRILGYTLKEARGAGMLPLYTDMHDREMIIRALMENGRVDKHEIVLQSKSGNPKTVLTSVVLDESGIASGVVQDITELKNAEKKLLIKDAALDSSLTPFGIADMDGRIMYLNPACYRLWGYEDDSSLIGTNVVDYFGRDKYQGVIEQVKDMGSWTGEHVAIRKDGSSVDVYLTVNLLMDESNNPVCLLASFMDVSHFKDIQQQLVAAEQQAVTGRLAASVAHEINSPLQAIKVTLKNLKQKAAGPGGMEKDMEKGLEIVEKSFQNIENTVKNLMELNRPGAYEKQPADINEILNMAVDLMRGQLKSKGINIVTDLAPRRLEALVSVQHLSQVFLNLINNAMEATSEPSRAHSKTARGQIKVQSSLESGRIVITVSDNGPGIPEDGIDRIFEPFFTTKDERGIGVGLSTCYEILKEHGGDIVAKNAPSGGCIFTVRLPQEV